MTNSEFQKMISYEWVEMLETKLGVSRTVFLERGLSASVFAIGAAVQLEFADGSNVCFQHAFSLENPEKNQIVVFTEHCGYHVFPYEGTKIKHTKE